MDHAARIGDVDVLALHAQQHHHVEAGDGGRAGAGNGQLDPADVLAHHLQRVEQRRGGDDGGAVLVVVEDRDVHALAQLLLDVEAFRRLDVFQVDAAHGRLQHGDGVDQLVRIVLRQFQVEHVDPGEFLEQAALAFHDGLGGQRADVTQAQHGGAVADHGHQVAARSVVGSGVGVGGDFLAGIGHAGRIGERQVALVRQGLGGDHFDLAAHGAAVVFEGIGAELGICDFVEAGFCTHGGFCSVNRNSVLSGAIRAAGIAHGWPVHGMALQMRSRPAFWRS